MAALGGGAGERGSDDVLGAYLRDIRHSSLLSRSDEQELARTIEEGRAASEELEQEGDRLPPERRRVLCELVSRCEQATRRFVESNLRLVVSIAKRYRHPRLPLPDLVQEGNLGLMQAVRRFDRTKGFRFSTYATFWIRQSISRAISSSGRLIRLPAEAGDAAVRISRTRDVLEAQLGRAPTVDELAAELGMTPARVAELLTAAVEPVSTSEPAGRPDGPELAEALADASAEDVLEAALAEMVPEQVERLLERLDDRDRRVLCLRFGLDGHEPRSRAAVGECLGLSSERIRQIEARALARLRRLPEASEAWESLNG